MKKLREQTNASPVIDGPSFVRRCRVAPTYVAHSTLLKLKFTQYPAMRQIACYTTAPLDIIQRCRPITCYTTAPLYNKLIIFDTVVTQKRNYKHEKWWIHRCRHLATFAASPRLLCCQATYVDGRKPKNSSFWKIVLLLHPHADVFRIVWLLHNLSLGGQLCLHDDKKYCVCISSPSLAIAGEHRKRHPSRALKQEGVSDWLNPHSLGTMLAFGCIENLA